MPEARHAQTYNEYKGYIIMHQPIKYLTRDGRGAVVS